MKKIKWSIIFSMWVIYWAWEVVEVHLGFETFDSQHLMEVVVKLSLFSGIVYFVFRQIEQRNHKVVDLGAYYESIVDNAATGVIAVDREGRITTWNRYMEEEYKIKRAEVMGKNIFEFFPPIQTDGIGQGIRTVLNTGQPLVVDRVRHKTKRVGEKIIDFRIYPLKNSLEKVVGIVLLNNDVTEKVKLEEESEKLERKYKDLVESTPDWVWEVNQDGIYIYASPKIRDILGYEIREVIGKTPFDFMPEREAEKISKFFQEKRIKKEPFVGLENINRHKDGHLVVLETNGIPVLDEKGDLIGYRGIDRDITERKKKEEELEKTREQLIQAGKLASTGQLAAGVAHELNNPLTSISGFAQLLFNQMDKEDPGYKSVKTIVEETKRCRSIIQNLLSFSRQSQKEELELLDVNLPLKATMGLVREQMKFRNIELMEDLAPNLPLIKANPNHLQQVFMNLVVNAQDAIPQGGKLYIKTRTVEGNKKVEIAFRDTGSGIPEEHLDKIFNPFFTTKRPGRGVGLGLSVSYGIIEDHGGWIKVESKIGEGSIFTITLPTEGSYSGKKT